MSEKIPEPVYQFRCEGVNWIDCTKKFYDDWKGEKRILYTTPPEMQESEAVAVVTCEGVKGVSFSECCSYGCDLPVGTKLYLAPPSAQAIKTAEIMRAVEVCRQLVCNGNKTDDGSYSHASAVDCMRAIEALIPQDGRTALEHKCMEVAEAVKELCSEYSPSKDRLQIAVYHVLQSTELPVSNEGGTE